MTTVAPPSIKPASTYFERARELANVQPCVSHHLRLFGVETAMKMSRDQEASRFLLSQMDALEAEKKDKKYTAAPPKREAFQPAPPPPPPVAAAAVDVSDGPPPPPAKSDDAGKKDDAAAGASDGDAKKDASKTDEAAADALSTDVSDKLKTDDSSKGPTFRTGWFRSSTPAAAPAPASAPPAAPAPPPQPAVQYRMVAQTPSEHLKSFALDLYERARAADDPKAYPSASTSWGVVEAPKIARGLHCAAVVLDALKQWAPLPADLQRFQMAAHKRSQQLGQQIHNSFKTGSPVPLEWAPVDVAAPFAGWKPPPPPGPTARDVAAMFPSAPGGR